jgi:hypothetical protein
LLIEIEFKKNSSSMIITLREPVTLTAMLAGAKTPGSAIHARQIKE